MAGHDKTAISDLQSTVEKCLNMDLDSDSKTEARSKLLDFEVIHLVQALQTFLLSENSGTRREAVSTLSWLVGCHAGITPLTIPHLVAFFCSRLSDWASVEPSVQGIRTLYANHIKADFQIRYIEESEEALSRDRSDLSLMLGLNGVSSLPPRTSSMTERVMTKLLINVHAPSFGQQVRYEVLELFKQWIRDFSEELLPVADILVKGLAIEGEDERDVVCLGSFFEAIDSLFLSGLAESSSPRSLEELFDILKSYFPVQFVAKQQDVDSLSRIKVLLSRTLAHFKLQSIEFLTPLLSDPTLAEDAYVCLVQIGKECPNELIPFLLGEWNTKPSLLLKKLWQSTIAAADCSIVEGLISRLVAQEEEELLVMSGETNCAILVIVLSELLRQEKKIEILVSKMHVDDFEILSVPAVLANASIASILSGEGVGLLFASRMVPFANDLSVLEKLIDLVKIGLKSDNPLSSDITATIASLAKCHSKLLVEKTDSIAVFSRLVRENSFVAATIASTLHSSGQWTTHHLELVREKIILLVDAFKEGLADVFATYLDQGLIYPADLSSEPLAQIILHVSEPERSGKMLRDAVTADGRLDIVPFIGAERLRLALRGEAAVWGDLISAGIFLVEPIAVKTVPVIASAAWLEARDSVYRVMGHCESEKVWSETYVELARIEEVSKISEIIFAQKTVHRIESFLTLAGGRFPEIIAYLLTLVKREEETQKEITVRLLSALSPEALVQESHLVESCLMIRDVGALKLLAKYVVVDQNVRESVLVRWIEETCGFVYIATPIFRFSAFQTLALVPETVASGKLTRVTRRVLAVLRTALDSEPRLVVRKQVAIAITNWFNIS